MENDNTSESKQSFDTVNDTPHERVGFPQVEPMKSKSFPKILIIIVLLLFFGGALFLIFSKPGEKENLESTSLPTPFVEDTNPSPTTPPEVMEEAIDKDKIEINILNGSGISGAAGIFKKELEKLGYSKIEVGNASKQTYVKTLVTFDSSISESVKKEILDSLGKIYQGVESDVKSSTSFDVEIITGYPKGYTPTPSSKQSTPTPTPTSKVTGTITPTGSVTVTQTPTPTP